MPRILRYAKFKSKRWVQGGSTRSLRRLSQIEWVVLNPLRRIARVWSCSRPLNLCWQWVRGFPNARATTTWLAIITATQLVLTHGSERLDSALLRSASTNLHNLRADPVSVLIISACFVPTFWSYVEFAVACVLVLAPLENWIGTWRWLAGLFIGHVGSTVAVAVGLWVSSLRSGTSSERVIDVGVSYGVWFLVAVLVHRWPRMLWLNASLVVTMAVGRIALAGDFSDRGHLVAVLSGLAVGSLLVRSLHRDKYRRQVCQ